MALLFTYKISRLEGPAQRNYRDAPLRAREAWGVGLIRMVVC